MSPARPTRWGVAGCRSGLLEPLGTALRDSGLATGVAILADPPAWEHVGDRDSLAGILPEARVLDSPGFAAFGVQAAYVSATLASSGNVPGYAETLLARLAGTGCALLIEPPLPAGVDGLAGRGVPRALVAAAHLLRWHPAAVTASDAVEAGDVGDVRSAEVVVGGRLELPAVLDALDVLGLVLAGDDVADLAPARPSPVNWRLEGQTRGGIPITIEGGASGPEGLATSVGVTGTRAGILASLPGIGAFVAAGDRAGSVVLDVEGLEPQPLPLTEGTPVRSLVDRFSRAAVGGAPWGWSLARDLRLQALAEAAMRAHTTGGT